MGHFPLEGQHILLSEILQRQRYLKAAVAADGHRFQPLDFLHGINQSCTGVFLIGQNIAPHRHAGKAVLRMGMFRQRLHICLKSCDESLVLFNLFREVTEKVVLQPVLLTLMVGLHQLQPCHIHIQIHLLLDALVTGTERLDLRIGQRGFINVLTASHRAFACHNLRNKLLLVFKRLPEISVKGGLRHIAEDVDLLVPVSLTDDSSGALFQVARPPRRIQIMKRHKPVLHVHAGPHFEGAAHQHTHLTGTDFGKQFFLPCLGIGLMDKGDLFSRNASCHQFLPDVIVDGELRFRRVVLNSTCDSMKLRIIQITADRLGCFRRWSTGFGCAQVAKHQLGQFVRLTLVPDAVDVIHTHIDLARRVIRQIRIDDALVESQLSAVRGDAEHIVHAGVHRTGMDFGSAL